VIVNGTSVGLAGREDVGRLPLRLRRGQVAVDFVYGDTELARQAREAGARLVSGEALLVKQGALAFQLWTGRPAPEAVMAAALAPGRKE
jgi:shikimate dehydrogenase